MNVTLQIACFTAALMVTMPTAKADLTAARQALAQYKIDPAPTAVLRWLDEMQRPGPPRDQVQRDLELLNDEDFEVREAATNRLEQAAFVPPRMLDEAIVGKDFERRWRALRVRERAENRQSWVLSAALQILLEQPSPSLAPQLVDALRLARHPDLQEDFLDAIRRRTTAADRADLQRRLDPADPLLRRGAVAGLMATASPDELTACLTHLDDPDERVVFEAARGLLDRGDPRGLPALVAQLRHARADVRVLASGLLRAATHQDIGFDPYEPADRQAASIAAWEKWLAEKAPAAQLARPIVWRPTGRGDLAGHTLMSTGRKGQVLEVDAQGRVVWRFSAKAWSAEKLSNGNVLIAALDEQRLLEVDSVGNAIWQWTGIGAIRAKPLASGNYLVADFTGKQILEINRRHSIVWRHPTPDDCFDVDRLPNGHTVFGCANLAREITPDFRTVREWTISGRLNGLQALPGGRLLVANFGAGRVVELDPDGRELWRYDEPQPSDAYRLTNGRTLITTATRIIEIDADKKLIREWSQAVYGSARR